MYKHIFLLALIIAAVNGGAISYAGGVNLNGGGIGLGGLGDGGLGGLGGIGLGGLGGIGLGGLGGGGLGGIGVVGKQTIVDVVTPAKYEFKYGVEDPKTGDRKEQSEVRLGDTVKGQYSLAEPDGTIRVVKYTADKVNGFNAIVSRIGHAAHPSVLLHKSIGIGGIGGIGL